MNIQIMKVVIPQGFPQVFGYDYESGDSPGFSPSVYESGDSPGGSPSVWI